MFGPQRKHSEVNFDIYSVWLKAEGCQQTYSTFAQDKDIFLLEQETNLLSTMEEVWVSRSVMCPTICDP